MYYEDLGNDNHSDWMEFSILPATVSEANPYWYPKIPEYKFEYATSYVTSSNDYEVWTENVSRLVGDTILYMYELKRASYLIMFESNGGNRLENVRVESLVYPKVVNYYPDAVMTKDGFNFKGWFADAALSGEWTWKSEVIRDTTLYAKWEAVPDVPDSGGSAIKGNKGFDGKYGIIAVKNPVVGDFAEFVVKTPERWIDAKLTIYDNVGNVVFSNERRLTISDNRMKWNLRNGNARAVASGIYLAVVECKGANGVYQYYTKFGVRK